MKKILLALGLFQCFSAFAGDLYSLSCDDGKIFETPLLVKMEDGRASVSGMFSGAGGAVFEVEYKNLKITNFLLNPSESASIKIQDERFLLSVKGIGLNDLRGKISMRSSDDSDMLYQGNVRCKIQKEYAPVTETEYFSISDCSDPNSSAGIAAWNSGICGEWGGGSN